MGGGLKNLNSACDLFSGVIRTLSHGFTLKREGATGWIIDLAIPGLHKARVCSIPPPSTQLVLRFSVRPAVQTSRTYGPSRTPISKLVVPSLNRLLEVTFASRFLAAPINALAGEAWGRI